MPFDNKNLEDYVDVAQRIADFREQYPEGCLQPLDPTQPFEIREITGTTKDGKEFTATMIVYIAAAYRDRDDPRPGIGCAWEPFPGRTPYTLGSELMNAETSAWGRSIIAVLASDSKRGVASREEVRNRNAEADASPDSPPAKRGRRQPPPERAPDALPRNRDGGISRSQATDQELAAAGNMTDAQIREHNRLQRDVQGTGPQGTERLTGTPDDDPWQLPVPRASQPIDRRIIMHFQRLGVPADQRDLRLQMTAELAGRSDAISSTKQLTAQQGIDVERLLARCRNRQALDALLDTMTPSSQPSPPIAPVAATDEAGPTGASAAGPAVQEAL